MTAKLLKGQEVVDSLVTRIRNESEELRGEGIVPTLGIIRVGNKPGDLSYEKGAAKRAAACEVDVKNYIFPEDIPQEELISQIHLMNEDKSIHGILLLRPLPGHMDDNDVRNAISPQKDVDGITDGSMAGVFTGTSLGFPPCTPRACIEILDHYGIHVEGKKIVVVGRSLVVGRPLAMMLMKRNATITICHTNTKEEDLADICRGADVLFVAAGVAKMINNYHIREGQTVVDVGINMDENGKLCGDVDFEKVSGKVAAITPVPGGVGSTTTGLLMKHVIEAARKCCGRSI